jgi:hypothetical protein
VRGSDSAGNGDEVLGLKLGNCPPVATGQAVFSSVTLRQSTSRHRRGPTAGRAGRHQQDEMYSHLNPDWLCALFEPTQQFKLTGLDAAGVDGQSRSTITMVDHATLKI